MTWPGYNFRRLPDGTWQRRKDSTEPWLTLQVRWVTSRQGASRSKEPRWEWRP
jgi:hypothetical protein